MRIKSINKLIRIFVFMALPWIVTLPLSGQTHERITAERLLCPNGKAIGQPLSRVRPDVRMVRVYSSDESYWYFLALCGVRNVTSIDIGGYRYYRSSLPDKGGIILFTHHVRPNRNEVGALYLNVPEVNKSEIRKICFVQAIKIK